MQKWKQPKLIILGRGHPQENVLSGCKTSQGGPDGSKPTCAASGCMSANGS